MTARAYGTLLADTGSKRCRPCYRKAGPRRNEGRSSFGNLQCSFCGKSQREVATLIAGPTVYILDERGTVEDPMAKAGAEIALRDWPAINLLGGEP